VQNEFLSLVRPSAFSCSLAFSHPSHPPLTQTVRRNARFLFECFWRNELE
jgi:hypothetical protein